MIKCNLGGKSYAIDFVTGRALREMEGAWDAYTRITRATAEAMDGKEPAEAQTSFGQELDALVKWFCLLFQNQFTPDEFIDGYPVDRMVHDIVFALLAVRSQTTEVLDTFPTTAAKPKDKAKG